jgi:DNA-binding IclR family transcriptional regulator
MDGTMMGVTVPSVGAPAPGAPALEKGLDILEALADEPVGLTQKAIAERVGRSVGEIFRMLGALERRGYVTRDLPSGQYRLTLRLFDLAHRNPPTRLLLQAAQGEMERLANKIDQACHLVGLHGSRIVVMAQSQPERQLMGWAVRVGASFPLSVKYASARVLAAFQRPDRRGELVARMHEESPACSRVDLQTRLEKIACDGFEMAPSSVAQGVTDISMPILDHAGAAVAALTVAAVFEPASEQSSGDILEPIRATAVAVTRAIGGNTASRK